MQTLEQVYSTLATLAKPIRSHSEKEVGGRPDKEAGAYAYLRPQAQAGGLIRPRYLWSCITPEDRIFLKKTSKTVWGRMCIGIEDIYGKYGMEAFYFRHTNLKSQLDRSTLWPDMDVDEGFRDLFVLTVKTLLGSSVSVQDIVDFGFIRDGQAPPQGDA